MGRAERTYYGSLEDALDSCFPLSSADARHVRSIVALLEEQIGPVYSIYVRQNDSVVGMSFGGSQKVGLYLLRTRIDVAPDEVEACGGHAGIAQMYPGFVRASGQRSSYARFRLSGWTQDR